MHDDEPYFIVEVMPRNGDKSDPGYRRFGPMRNAQAVRLDNGINRNLNHHHYHTLISVEGSEHGWRSETGLRADREARE
jgi:hypothetical protein